MICSDLDKQNQWIQQLCGYVVEDFQWGCQHKNCKDKFGDRIKVE